MSLSIRCTWSHRRGPSIEERVRQVAAAFLAPEVLHLVGTRWFRGGNSKRAALSKPVALDAVGTVAAWTQGEPVGDVVDYQLNMWNGSDFPASYTVSFALQDPPEKTTPHFPANMFLISGMQLDHLRGQGVEWEDILRCARMIANTFKGVSAIRTTELTDIGAEKCGIEEQARAYIAHAAFWADALGETHPPAIILSDPLASMDIPDCGRLRELVAHLSMPEPTVVP